MIEVVSKRAKDLWLALHDKTQNAEAWAIIDEFLVGAVLDLEIRGRAVRRLDMVGTSMEVTPPPVATKAPAKLPDYQEEDVFDFLSAIRYSSRLENVAGACGDLKREARIAFEDAEAFLEARRERMKAAGE